MPREKVSRDEFVRVWDAEGGSPTRVAERLGIAVQNVHQRRVRLAGDGVLLKTADYRAGKRWGWQEAAPKWPKRREINIRDATAIIGSDAHLWPGMETTAWRAFKALVGTLKPKLGILNGDTLDGSRVTRHDPIAWECTPDLAEEIEWVKDETADLRKRSRGTDWYWTCGNHDTRFERYLAKNAPEMRNVKGSCLQDHIGWPFSWSIMLNPNSSPVMVKHAFRGGAHAVYNNTLQAGISIVTGHLHAQLVRPFTDYRGTRYGVDCGTLADLSGPQFNYTLDNPLNWRSGFAVLTFDKDGILLPPELCEVQTLDGSKQRAVFRGEVIATGEAYREDVAA